ncbi:PhoX family phosphatase [Orrella sp. JC864]|uniref:PhoX family protein n=1 Tax=Orrella sp. JC864 TaxID=3120298 RepID=UPI00300AD0FC
MSSVDLEDIPTNPSGNTPFNEIVERARARRGFLKTGLGLGAVGFLGMGLAACSSSDDDDEDTPPSNGEPNQPGEPNEPGPAGPLLGFAPVAASSGDTIVVPEGYRSAVFCRWGDPLVTAAAAWKPDATNTAEEQALQFGDNHDGMHFFPLGDENNSTEGLLVMNHEYLNDEFFYPPGIEPGGAGWTLEQVRKGQHAHGVAVAHVRLVNGNWEVVVPSRYNRRIHINTLMQLTGPASGHRLMQTSADPLGLSSYGTVNNCGNGFTMWGTYLTCEENFNGYFGTTNPETAGDQRDAAQRRYGISRNRSGYRWEDHDPRFDYVLNPTESNRFGWIVEIDPYDPDSVPKKRTALGRFKHENAAQTLAADKRVVVYMGDDQANDYIYKFVSDGKFDESNPMLNRNLLETGTLYVARFDAGEATGDMMGTGQWIALRPDTPKVGGGTLADDFADLGEILIYARLAADAVGATPMDRPEWVTVHPQTGEVYCTLTNNSGRSAANVDDANPRANNVYGQIVRWRETGNDAAALTFEWDLFVLAGNPTVGDGLVAGSSNVTAENIFNSPDGLAFDKFGRLWIQTDGNFSNTGAYAGMGNNQMLVADPQAGAGNGEIRRFLVGPSGCEITGITFTPDHKYVFVNVQHPGEYGSHPNRPAVGAKTDPLAFSKWPEESGGRPRSATVVVWKEDGGVVGS